MPPATSLAALMQSPAYSDSTVIANGKTLPDITLGSFGSSFRSDEEEEAAAAAAAAAQGAGGARAGPSRGGRFHHEPSGSPPIVCACTDFRSKRTDSKPPRRATSPLSRHLLLNTLPPLPFSPCPHPPPSSAAPPPTRPYQTPLRVLRRLAALASFESLPYPPPPTQILRALSTPDMETRTMRMRMCFRR